MRRFAPATAVGLVLFAVSIAHAEPPVFTLDPDTLRADAAGMWTTSLVLENRGEWGLYPDSLFMDWTSEDTDSTAAPRRGGRSLAMMVHSMSAAGVGETTNLLWTGPQEFERGTVTFRFYSHDAKKLVFAQSSTLVITGSTLYDLHPQRLLPAGGRVAEMVVLAADSEQTPAPGVLVVPTSGVNARSMLRWGLTFANRRFTVGILSLPGSGRSTGPADMAGPASVAAIDAALAALAKEPGVDGKRLALWGLADGGTAVLLAAARHPELVAVIAQDASYDPWGTYRALAPPARDAYVRAAGRDSAGWRARSPLAVATRISAPVLVLDTSEPGAPDAHAAQMFASVRTDAKLYVEARIGAIEGHPLSRRDAQRVATDFLARRTRQP